jgi:uracil-DNA glycosylase family 4
MEDRERMRLSYLESMGIQAWSLRLPSAGIEAAGGGGAAALPPAAVGGDSVAPEPPVSPEPPHPANAVELKLGVSGLALTGKARFPAPTPCFVNPTESPPPAHLPEKLPSVRGDAGKPQPGLGWDELQARVASCTACALHQTRTQTVFGVGDRCADWMVIGEAPGEQEDLQGEPFVGRAGLLLNEMLRAIGLERGQVYIANILKCRPPKNRDPQVEEASACEGHLKQQLALVKPKIVLAVGRIAAQNLLKTTTPIGRLRGVVHDYQGVPLVVVYHPAYLLRSPLEKRRAFDDLRLALHTYRQTL